MTPLHRHFDFWPSAQCVEVGIFDGWRVVGTAFFPPPRKIKFVAVVKGACWLSPEGQGCSSFG